MPSGRKDRMEPFYGINLQWFAQKFRMLYWSGPFGNCPEFPIPTERSRMNVDPSQYTSANGGILCHCFGGLVPTSGGLCFTKGIFKSNEIHAKKGARRVQISRYFLNKLMIYFFCLLFNVAVFRSLLF
jgi:hypothetical protein